jgi:cyclohexadieny/prephenate dehydrogenase
VLEMLARFSEDLTALQRAIRFGDGETLYKLFVEARAVRRGIIQAGQDTAVADFGRHGVVSKDAGGAPGKTPSDP